MKKIFLKLIFGTLFTCAFTGGAIATWRFAEGNISSQNTSATIEIAPFNWEGAEDLPDDVIGEDHHKFIDLIINSDNGLNTPDSYLNKQIDERKNGDGGIFGLGKKWDTYGSMDAYDAKQMESIFQTDTDKLTFLLKFPEDEPNIQYLYTTSVDLGESAYVWEQEKNNIPTTRYVYIVYRTVLQLETDVEGNAKWVAQTSERGYAQSAWYDNDMLGDSVAKNPSFDPDSWKKGKQGAERGNSIYAYVGQTTTAYVDSITETAYYDITPKASGTVTVSTSNKNAKFSVFVLENGKETNVETQSASMKDENGNDVFSVSWTVTQNITYYMRVVGDTSITFTIS